MLGDTWYMSHNFDQRLLIDNDKYVILGHGDAYPRSLVFAVWNTDLSESVTNEEAKTEFFEISGEIGDNTTNTLLGGIIKLNDGNYGVCFSSSEGRDKYDVCYMKIDASGNILKEEWITTNTEFDANYPRIAKSGNNIILAWSAFDKENYSNDAPVYFTEIDYDGNTTIAPFIAEDAVLPYQYDFINLPGGDIFWATGTEENSLKQNWIKQENLE